MFSIIIGPVLVILITNVIDFIVRVIILYWLNKHNRH